MCFTMLIGTTFAWFTDEVTSSGNVIKSGKLDIEFENYNYETGKWETASQKAIFSYDKWEPGYTQKVNLRVVNKGTLALKWMAAITTEQPLSKLADVINVYVRANDQYNEEAEKNVAQYINDINTRDLTDAVANGDLTVCTLREFIENCSAVTTGNLLEGQTAYLGLILQMDESADNDYQDLDLGGKFDITILATQLASEKDSYDENYDAAAPFYGSTTIPAVTEEAGEDVHVYNDKNEKIGSINIPSAAVAEGASIHVVNITESNYTPNITVNTGYQQITFDISVSGLKENNQEPIKVSLYIGQGINPATVSAYHYDELVFSSYNPYTGYVKFETTSFSPFTLAFDEQSIFVPPVVGEDGVPVASVTAQPSYVGVSLPWGSYGQWSPNESVDADPKLEAAYVFSCTETFEEAKENDYALWECDFFVKLDRALGENQIFLGGNYGSFGWVGFHNGDVVLQANEEVPLLGSVTNNAWTYLDVVQFVGTFTCGVGDVNDALSGATFTVTLRLTNPENRSQTIDVSTINYTFQ